ncbi:hypothetical protein [Actinomadura vinacea]|uniref:hypothetical protein n=1 Tax=Actinomadura vinacea TaxID=115336 RepID=UPI0031DCD1F0
MATIDHVFPEMQLTCPPEDVYTSSLWWVKGPFPRAKKVVAESRSGDFAPFVVALPVSLVSRVPAALLVSLPRELFAPATMPFSFETFRAVVISLPFSAQIPPVATTAPTAPAPTNTLTFFIRHRFLSVRPVRFPAREEN